MAGRKVARVKEWNASPERRPAPSPASEDQLTDQLRTRRARGLAGRWREPLLVLLAVAAFALIGARWLLEFRRGLPMDIDEAGYQAFALNNHRAFEEGGVSAWADSVLGPSIFAPLMTATTSVGYEVLGVHRSLGLFVALALGCLTLLACYGLGHAIAGRREGWLCLAVAAAAPVLISYSRTYNFAIAAAAAAAVTLWALARSDRWLSGGWSVVAGAGLGALVLARTMTVALVPALVLAAAVAVAVGPQRRRRALNVLLSGAVALVVAGPWYYRNGHAVLTYLTSFGYGNRRAEYGADESLLSPRSWRAMVEYTLVTNIGLPLAALSVVSIVLLVMVGFRRSDGEGSRWVRWLRSPLLPSFLFAIWGIVILTSTGNKGSGFLAPLVPAFAALVAAAVVRMPVKLRWTLTTGLLATLLLNTAAGVDVDSPLAEPRVVQIDVLGSATLVDGGGNIQDYIASGMLKPPAEPEDPMAQARQRAWVVANRRLATQLDAGVLTTFGFRHRLLNPNSVQFENLLTGGTPLPIVMIEPLETPDEPTMAAWLGTGAASTTCDLLIAPGTAYEFEPVADPAALRRAARATGFAPTEQTWRLPDLRLVTRWHRTSCP